MQLKPCLFELVHKFEKVGILAKGQYWHKVKMVNLFEILSLVFLLLLSYGQLFQQLEVFVFELSCL